MKIEGRREFVTRMGCAAHGRLAGLVALGPGSDDVVQRLFHIHAVAASLAFLGKQVGGWGVLVRPCRHSRLVLQPLT